MTPSSRSGDGWSDTSWSDPSYARPRDPRRPATPPSRGSDDGWGDPSYSRPAATPATAPTGAPRRRPASPPAERAGERTAVQRPAERAGERTAVQRPAGSPDRRRGVPAGAGAGTAARPDRPRRPVAVPADDDAWVPSGPTSAREQRATRVAERRAEQERLRTQRSVEKLTRRTEADPYAAAAPAVPERGMHWFRALLVLIAITVLGALVDAVASISGQDGFNTCIVIGSVAGILLVRRSQMFPIVVAPPIVYSVAAIVQLYLKSSLNSTRHGLINTLLDAVQNYLVYGFPALAVATAAVLIIAGIRLVVRR